MKSPAPLFPIEIATASSRYWTTRRPPRQPSERHWPDTRISMANWRIEPLDSSHLREQFFCSKAPLDDSIHTLVGQYERRKLGRTYVAVRQDSRQVFGYYTLCSG